MATSQEGNVSFKQIRKSHRLGDGLQAQSCDGTFTFGNLPDYADDGTLKDSGIPAANIGGLTIGFVVNTGAPGADVGPIIPAPHAGTLSSCIVVVKASDPATALTFTIKQNGTPIFSVDPTVAANTPYGTLASVGTFTSNPLSVAKNDQFTIDISSGSAAWQFTAQLT